MDEIELERREPDEVAQHVVEHIRPETRQALLEWTVRAGLGPVFVQQAQDHDFTAEEVGSLLALSFDPEKDPVHNTLYDTLVYDYAER